MLSLPAHDLWAEYSFPLHACFYHVLERPQSWCFQWNTCILIIRVNKCFIWNSLLVNTLMVHKMCDEKQQCVGRWQNMAHVQSPVSHAESGERSRKQMSYILLFLPLLWLPLITESRETWLQRLCSGDELAGPQSRLRMELEENSPFRVVLLLLPNICPIEKAETEETQKVDRSCRYLRDRFLPKLLKILLPRPLQILSPRKGV